MYQSIIFVGASALIVGAKLITRIIAAPAFFDSWQYIPTLVMATAMSCFVTFLGTVYVVEKKSKSSLVTTVIGTVVNLGANFVLIDLWGAHGAALSTALSYGLVVLLRAIHTRKFIPIGWSLPRFTANMGLTVTQCFVMVFEIPYWEYICTTLFAVVVFINFHQLLGSLKQMRDNRIPKH